MFITNITDVLNREYRKNLFTASMQVRGGSLLLLMLDIKKRLLEAGSKKQELEVYSKCIASNSWLLTLLFFFNDSDASVDNFFDDDRSAGGQGGAGRHGFHLVDSSLDG